MQTTLDDADNVPELDNGMASASRIDPVQPTSSNHLFTRNPKGRNQHKDCPRKDDAQVAEWLHDYHQRGITDRRTVQQLLQSEHGVSMSLSTLSRRRKTLGLRGSGATTREMPDADKRALVVAQMAQDPLRKHGPRAVKEAIATSTGVHLTRDYIAAEMRTQDPVGFALRNPVVNRHAGPGAGPAPPPAEGIHRAWTCTSSEKLAKLGFRTWSVRDWWSGKWFGMWVIPERTFASAVGWLRLRVIADLGGMPPSVPSHGKNEVPPPCHYVDSLRQTLGPDLSPEDDDLLCSVRKLSLERSLLQEHWVNDVLIWWSAGSGIYTPSDPKQYELVQWLWPKLLQRELTELTEFLNMHQGRKGSRKHGPTGVSPLLAYSLRDMYAGADCLCPVPREAVSALVQRVDGEALLRFGTAEYAARAEEVFRSLGYSELTFQNVWPVFGKMLPHM